MLFPSRMKILQARKKNECHATGNPSQKDELAGRRRCLHTNPKRNRNSVKSKIFLINSLTRQIDETPNSTLRRSEPGPIWTACLVGSPFGDECPFLPALTDVTTVLLVLTVPLPINCRQLAAKPVNASFEDGNPDARDVSLASQEVFATPWRVLLDPMTCNTLVKSYHERPQSARPRQY